MEENEVINTPLIPSELIQVAIAQGADLEKLEKLLSLQERWQANEARKAYCKDFSSAQADIEPVAKKATNPQTHSKYALLENVIDVTKPIYTKYGFSIIFYEGETNKPEHIRINADVLHTLGHKETYYYDVPLDGMGIKGNANMTKIHAKASSTSYGRRYLMCMIWNISTTSDSDGNVVEQCLDVNRVNILKALIKETGTDEKKFLEYMAVESVEKIPESQFAKGKMAFEQKKRVK